MSRKTIVVFSGAGLSKESGVPTFRDAFGLWNSHEVDEVASRKAWDDQQSRTALLNFHAERWHEVRRAEPNAAHRAIADLEEKFDVLNITQNFDDLLERAGCSNVWHLHGDILTGKCEWHMSAGCLYDHRNYTCDYRRALHEPVKLGDQCPKCGGQMRPDVVWFGECVDMKPELVKELVSKTEVFVAVGTSAQVQPAAGLLTKFVPAPKKYYIDPRPPRRPRSFTRLKGTAGYYMPVLVKELLAGC